MANNIQRAILSNPIKNGTVVTSTTRTGSKSVLDTYVKNTPAIASIQTKYSNRFSNGILVSLVNGVDGGTITNT